MNCPSCSSPEVQARGKRYALYPAGIVALIGWPFAMLHQVSSPREYRCRNCGADFSHRTTTARIARVLLIIFGTAFALLIATIVVVLIIAQIR